MKSKNTVLMVAIAFLISAAVICIVGAAREGYDFLSGTSLKQLDMEEYSVSAGDVKAIFIQDKDKKLSVAQSEDDKIHVIYYKSENPAYNYTIGVDSGKLSVVSNDQSRWFERVGFWVSLADMHVTLKIPAEFAGELELRTSNSSITMYDVNVTGRVLMKTSNSSVSVSNVNVGDTLSAETTNGGITLSNVETDSLIMKNSNGKLDMLNLKVERLLDGKTSNGKIYFRNIDAEDIKMKTNNSIIEFSNITVGKAIDCKTSNGKITGDVNGPQSDYSITSKTSNGNNNLPTSAPGGEKKMNMVTSNSKIEVTFK
ncbi:MAG: DUF4097 domain-containing protein [Oscillospiraceae bacterium]|nr:DUF4097 domain-containing protein [Oscillospiraceae bacterium]